MCANDQVSKILPLSKELQTVVAESKKSFPDIKTLPVPNNATFSFYTLTPEIAREIEKEYHKITSVASPSNHFYTVVLFRGESTLGTDYSSIFIPLVAIGNPMVKGFENVAWDGTQLLYVSEKIVLNLSETDRLGALVVSFPKE